MINRITKWLEARHQAAIQSQYEDGYGYAAVKILKYGETPMEAVFDWNAFDNGVRDAETDIEQLKYAANKLERIEAENKDLREIVQRMQKELGRLLVELEEVSRPQALSEVPVAKPKLPFKLDEIPGWANWVAKDENGDWYGYEIKPYKADCQWLEESKDGEVERLDDCILDEGYDWEKSLFDLRQYRN